MQDSSTGADNPSACMVVLFSALIGLAISTVCKYADAVVKTFATATVAANLVILSSLYGLQQPSVVAWMGVLVVVTAMAMYGRITQPSRVNGIVTTCWSQ
jgi:hypothetical protein